MTAVQFLLGLVRLAAVVLPAVVIAGLLRRRLLAVRGPIGALVECVLGLSELLVASEAVGLVGLLRAAVLIPVQVLIAVVAWRMVAARNCTAPACPISAPPDRSGGSLAAAVAVIVVAGQWLVQTADALGAGMFNFDTLWYHMPFAARMAQTRSVTGIQFTQADPFVAYFPANSELYHAIGLVSLGSDLASPLLNLGWLAAALLAAWCIGRPWGIERQTLIAGCLVMSLPVLSGTQPGEAFNDVVGLAMLLAGTALAVNAQGERAALAVAGLAFGIAVGTKFTFLVPAFALVVGFALVGAALARRRSLWALVLPVALTGSWWYLRNLIAVGNPLGLQLHVGPLTLPGPTSALAKASQQTVFSEVSHLSLWGSRFAPGLAHAIGPLWPIVLALYLLSVLFGVRSADAAVRAIAVAAGLTGISYLFLPTGASAIEQGTTLFQVNLRYATPALALGVVVLPVILRLRAPGLLKALGPGLVALLCVTQLEHALLPSQPARHVAFLAIAAGIAVAVLGGRAIRQRPRVVVGVLSLGLLLGAAIGLFAVQRHYFARRYLVGDRTDPGLGAIYRWAQGVADAHVALYGTVQQYPLYGARDTNAVTYLGTTSGGGGFHPVATCRAWRTAINDGGYRYVVLTPAPTAAIPAAWTRASPAAHIVVGVGEDDVFELTGRLDPGAC